MVVKLAVLTESLEGDGNDCVMGQCEEDLSPLFEERRIHFRKLERRVIYRRPSAL